MAKTKLTREIEKNTEHDGTEQRITMRPIHLQNDWRNKNMDKNCNSCRLGLLGTCEGLKNNAEYQAIWKKAETTQGFLGSLNAHEFKETFVCDQYKCRYIEYPLTITGIDKNTDRCGLRDSQVGKFAKVAPCGDEYHGKTFLGLYLGELPIDILCSHRADTGKLSVGFMSNPAIFVFDLNKIVYGCESWWSIIESEKDLKDIAPEDIQNVWYVKAIKQFVEQNKHEEDNHEMR